MNEESDNIARTVRSTTGLTQKAFSEKYHISVWTLRSWEQGVRNPDTSTRVYLSLIAAFPELMEDLVRSVSETSQSRYPQDKEAGDNL